MTKLPRGTVTFCFTDMEASTRLFARLGAAYLGLLDDHRQIIREAFKKRGGGEVRAEGDGFFFAFAEAASGVEAAVDAQRGLSEHAWPADAEVRVRIGLHTGRAEPVADDYVAFAVHEAARVAATGHGGQIVVSDVCRGACVGLDPAIDFADLGEHGLKDLPAAIRLWQVCHEHLGRRFPPLRTAAVRRGNLPRSSSPFIGRQREVGEVIAAIAGNRCTTVTGAGGVGKTRVALEAARARAADWPDGSWFIDLASVTDPSSVAEAIVAGLGIVRVPEVNAVEQLLEYARGRRLLLVLDNCEHVIAICAELVAAVLDGAPDVSVLATSREPLAVEGELTWRLPSLDAHEGRALFVDRAERSGPHRLGEDDETAIAQLCARLDGIPLAIELAAGRAALLTPRQIAERLDDRFRLLTGGARTALPRQRTLEAAVGWSYDLLGSEERVLLRRLSVFAGSFEIDAAEVVCDGEVLDTLGLLVAKSLVMPALTGDHIRYRLLETIRHYAWNKLLDAEEANAYRQRHVAYFVALAEQTVLGLFDSRESTAAARLAADLDNYNAALEWTVSTGDAESAHRVAGALWLFWSMGGRAREGLGWIRRVLAMAEPVDADLRAKVQAGAAHLGGVVRESLAEMQAAARMVVERWQTRGGMPHWYEAWALVWIDSRGANDAQLSDLVAARDAARQSGNSAILANVLLTRSGDLIAARRIDDALEAADEAVVAARASGASSVIAYTMQRKANALALSGAVDEAVALAHEAVGAARRGPNLWFAAFTLDTLGRCHTYRDDGAAAAVAYEELLGVAHEAGIDQYVGEALIELAVLDMEHGRLGDARRRLREASGLLRSLAGDRRDVQLLAALAGHCLNEVVQLEGDVDHARRLFEQDVAFAKSFNIDWVEAFGRCSLAWLAITAGDAAAAESVIAASAVLAAREKHPARGAEARAAIVRALAGVASARGEPTRAIEISAAASSVLEPNLATPRLATILHRRMLKECRADLGDAAFDVAWSVGRRTPIDTVLARLPSA